MKKVILAIVTVILAQTTFAADLYCGASTEKTPGSQVYDKLIFLEKIDTHKTTLKFILEDGTLINSDALTPDLLNKVIDGSSVISISFYENRPQLFTGRVKRNEKNEIKYNDISISSSFNGNNLMHIADGISLFCREM